MINEFQIVSNEEAETRKTAHLFDLLDLQKLIRNNNKKKREKRYLNTATYEFAVVFKMLLSWCCCSFVMMQSRSTEYPAILKFSKVIRKQ